MRNLLCYTCKRLYDGSCPGWVDELWTGKCQYYIPVKSDK